MKNLIIIIASLSLIHCGKSSQKTSMDSPSGPPPTISPSSPIMKVCRDSLVSTYGLVFRINTTTGDVVLLSEGVVYGFDDSKVWGVSIPGCHYVINSGIVSIIP